MYTLVDSLVYTQSSYKISAPTHGKTPNTPHIYIHNVRIYHLTHTFNPFRKQLRCEHSSSVLLIATRIQIYSIPLACVINYNING